MQATQLSKYTLRELDKICNDFLWGIQRRESAYIWLSKLTLSSQSIWGAGFRSHSDLKSIMLAKLGCKMIQGEQSMAKNCITSKYIKPNHSVAFQKGSHVWKNIGRSNDFLSSNIRWKLGDGKSINVWHDDWLGIGSLLSWVQAPLSTEKSILKVSHLIKENSWNLNDITLAFPEFSKDRIISHPIAFHSQDDWSYSNLVVQGKFSLCQAYSIYTQNRPSKEGGKWILKIKSSMELRFFMWLMWWDRIRTKLLLYLRKIISSPTCPCCKVSNVSSLLVMRDCEKTTQVYELLDPPYRFWEDNSIAAWLRDSVIFK